MRVRVAVCILTIFGMIWGVAALLFARTHGPVLTLPVITGAVVLAISWKGMPLNPLMPEQLARNRRIVRRWSLVEGVAMIAAVFLLQQASAQRYIPSVFAIIVGLHFLPLACGFPQPIFYATAAVMIVTGLLSSVITSPQLQGEIATSASAVALWASALALMLSYRRASTLLKGAPALR